MQLPTEMQNDINDFYRGKISLKELQERGDKLGIKLAIWDQETERNPAYPEGDNQSRAGFTWHTTSKLGYTFQITVKRSIIKVIDKIHSWANKEWDKDSFVYDDPRLQYLDKHSHEFIDVFFDHQERKLDFMHKVMDIVMWICMKEDIYYRARFLHMLNEMPYFVLTKQEIENINSFQKGIDTVNQFTMQPVKYFDGFENEKPEPRTLIG